MILKTIEIIFENDEKQRISKNPTKPYWTSPASTTSRVLWKKKTQNKINTKKDRQPKCGCWITRTADTAVWARRWWILFILATCSQATRWHIARLLVPTTRQASRFFFFGWGRKQTRLVIRQKTENSGRNQKTTRDVPIKTVGADVTRGWSSNKTE